MRASSQRTPPRGHERSPGTEWNVFTGASTRPAGRSTRLQLVVIGWDFARAPSFTRFAGGLWRTHQSKYLPSKMRRRLPSKCQGWRQEVGHGQYQAQHLERTQHTDIHARTRHCQNSREREVTHEENTKDTHEKRNQIKTRPKSVFENNGDTVTGKMAL